MELRQSQAGAEIAAYVYKGAQQAARYRRAGAEAAQGCEKEEGADGGSGQHGQAGAQGLFGTIMIEVEGLVRRGRRFRLHLSVCAAGVVADTAF